jgi:hypothetical protein
LDSSRKTALIVGTLFIVASATSIASFFFFDSIYSPDYLTVVSANENQVIVGALLMLTSVASIVGIPIALFSTLKKYNENLALGYVGARIFEGFFFAINIITLLSLLSLSHEFVTSAAPNVDYFQTTGNLLLADFEWNSVLLDIPFAISAIIFNYLLYKSKLVPRWMSGWGLIGGAVWLPGALIGIFSIVDVTLLAAPIGLQEMALAIWLIVKGFNVSALSSYSSKTD